MITSHNVPVICNLVEITLSSETGPLIHKKYSLMKIFFVSQAPPPPSPLKNISTGGAKKIQIRYKYLETLVMIESDCRELFLAPHKTRRFHIHRQIPSRAVFSSITYGNIFSIPFPLPPISWEIGWVLSRSQLGVGRLVFNQK